MSGGVSIIQGGSSRGGYERVLGFLREQLLSGVLKVGDRLLPERELAARLGVSRPVIREVLRAMAAMGVIDIRHGHGSVVCEPDISGMADMFSLMLAQNRDVADDVLEARIAIERHASRLACTRATPSDIVSLREAFAVIQSTISEPDLGGEADYEFHRRIVTAAHSATLSSLYAAIAVLLKRSHMERRRRIDRLAGAEAFLIDHHRLILDAIARHDADRADDLLAQHFKLGGDLQRRAAMDSLATT